MNIAPIQLKNQFNLYLLIKLEKLGELVYSERMPNPSRLAMHVKTYASKNPYAKVNQTKNL